MGYDLVRYLGESLGGPPNKKLIYFFLAYQLIVSALVFLFDSGFPMWVVIVGWVLFLVLLATHVLNRYIKDKREENEYQQQDQLRLQRISRLKERLKADPNLKTRCNECENKGAGNDPCRQRAGPAEREFRFRSGDVQSYCLFWSETDLTDLKHP